MNVIYKYELKLEVFQKIKLPLVKKLLSVQVQGDKICLWFAVDDKAIKLDVCFYVVGTGHEIPEPATNHIGTVQQGAYVWHIFTEGKL